MHPKRRDIIMYTSSSLRKSILGKVPTKLLIAAENLEDSATERFVSVPSDLSKVLTELSSLEITPPISVSNRFTLLSKLETTLDKLLTASIRVSAPLSEAACRE